MNEHANLTKALEVVEQHINQPPPVSHEEEIAVAAVRDRRELVARAEHAEALARQWEDHAHRLTSEIENANRLLAKAQGDRDFYLRHATELRTRLSDSMRILQGVMTESDEEAARPTLRDNGGRTSQQN